VGTNILGAYKAPSELFDYPGYLTLHSFFFMKNDSIRVRIPKIKPSVIAPALDPVIPGIQAEITSQIPIRRTIQPIVRLLEMVVAPVIMNTIPTTMKFAMLAPCVPTIPGINEAMTNQIAKIKVSQACQLIMSPPQQVTLVSFLLTCHF